MRRVTGICIGNLGLPRQARKPSKFHGKDPSLFEKPIKVRMMKMITTWSSRDKDIS